MALAKLTLVLLKSGVPRMQSSIPNKNKHYLMIVVVVVLFCVFFMMHLSRLISTIEKAPIIPLEHHIPFAAPCIRFEVFVVIIIPTALSLFLKQQSFNYRNYNDDN